MGHERKRLLTAEDLFRFAMPGSPAVSPDGSRVVYSVKRAVFGKNRYVSHLYEVPMRGGSARQRTQGEALDANPVFSPDGKHIAFVSKRGDRTQLYLMNARGGSPRALTKLEGGPIRQPVWSTDGRTILFGHRIQPPVDPKKRKVQANFKHITRLNHKLDGDGYLPDERWHLWTVAVRSGKAKQITFGENDDTDGSISPDGKRVAFASNRMPDADWNPGNADLYVMPLKGGRPRQVTLRYGACSAPAWSRDGRTLYFLGHFAPKGQGVHVPVHVYRIPAAGGAMKDLTPKLDRWLRNGVLADVNANPFTNLMERYDDGAEERLAFGVDDRGGYRIFSVAGKGGPVREEFAGDVNTLGLAVVPNGNRAAVVATTIMDAGEVYALRLDGSGAARRLTNVNRRVLTALKLTEPEEIVVRNGRTRVHGWILHPPDMKRGKKYPLVLQIHGGPACQYGYSLYHELHLLAAQGYVVAFCNPRGSDGYGSRFRACIQDRWGTDDFSDLMAFAAAVANRPYVDAKRQGVVGGSYGGFMTTWALTHSKRFRAGITMRQAGNRFTMFGTSDIGFYPGWYFRKMPWEDPMLYHRRSPNFYAHRITAPLLIIHSEEDYRCPLGQAQELFTTLKFLKRTVELVQFEGESHGLSRGGKPMNRLERLRRVTDWLKRYL